LHGLPAYCEAFQDGVGALFDLVFEVVVEFVLVRANGALQLLAILFVRFVLLFDIFLFFFLTLLPLGQPPLIMNVAESTSAQISTGLVILICFSFGLHRAEE
jgi:hypothetical protein